MSKYGVFSGPHFHVFGLNMEIYRVNDTEIYEVNFRIQSEYRKYGPKKTPYLDTFQAVRGVFKNFTKFTGKQLCQSLFFNKVASLRRVFLCKL